jgi:hypothetical protein
MIYKVAVEDLLKEGRRVLNDYDFMRRKRHLLVYEADVPCSKKEAAEAIKTAEECNCML